MQHGIHNAITHKEELGKNGYTILDHVYSDNEVERILTTIEQADKTKETFRKSEDLFAIRQFLKEVPEAIELIFTEQLNALTREFFGDTYFSVKSIYFDKPGTSNWYVAYHQDLTISVNKKVEMNGYGPWTVKQNQFAVQPPLDILKNIFTIRIHLDDTDEYNGALKVIPASHLNICRPETIDRNKDVEAICPVGKGGVMIMKPLLLHSSGRTINNKKRRVIHIEFANEELPAELIWAERLN